MGMTYTYFLVGREREMRKDVELEGGVQRQTVCTKGSPGWNMYPVCRGVFRQDRCGMLATGRASMSERVVHKMISREMPYQVGSYRSSCRQS